MKTLKTGLLMMAIIATFISCNKQDDQNELFDANLKAGSVIIPNVPVLNPDDCGELIETPLMAGQTNEVGKITVWAEGGYLNIKYSITNTEWGICETHLSVKNKANEIPHNNAGNPKIGQFEKIDTFVLPGVSEKTYQFPMNGFTNFYIAAHAVVKTQTGEECLALAELEAMIPIELVNIDDIVYSKVNSYYDLYLSNAGEFNGTHLAWCADNNGRDVDFNTANLISSYSTTFDLSQVVPNPANLPYLNYLMNTHYPAYSFPVIQACIWTLMNGSYTNPSGGLNLTDVQIVEKNTVMADVMANGGGFIPGPSDYLVILVHSGNKTLYQNIFFLYKKCTPIYSSETAWGAGSQFPGNNWAMYFGYCAQ